MVLTVRVSLRGCIAEEFAKKLGRAIASQVKGGIGDLSAEPIDKVQVIMKDVEGNNLELQTFA